MTEDETKIPDLVLLVHKLGREPAGVMSQELKKSRDNLNYNMEHNLIIY